MAEEQGLTFCRSGLKGQPRKSQTSKKYCSVCKLKVRGANHDEGSHHKSREKE